MFLTSEKTFKAELHSSQLHFRKNITANCTLAASLQKKR